MVISLNHDPFLKGPVSTPIFYGTQKGAIILRTGHIALRSMGLRSECRHLRTLQQAPACRDVLGFRVLGF